MSTFTDIFRKAWRPLLLAATCAFTGPAAAASMAAVDGGLVEPLFPIEGEGATVVAAFRIDVLPVTNAEFLAFVETHPEWQRGNVPQVFGGAAYLRGWASGTDLGALDPDAPVTNVTWFAAAAYCGRGARASPPRPSGSSLPTPGSRASSAGTSPATTNGSSR